jgi:diguanylate cyclase (GGDEF)-like protein/PAS domain S-box-containing protein
MSSCYSVNIDDIPVNVAIYKKVEDGFEFVAFNSAAEKTDQIKKEKLLGSRLHEMFPGVKEFGLCDVLQRVYETGKHETFDTTFYEDERISGWRRNEVIKLPDGNIGAFYFDRSLEKELERRGLTLEKELSKAEILLEHQKKMFQHIMENSESISVQGYNEKHEVIYWNKGSEKLYGYSSDEALSQKLEMLIIPEFMRNAVSEGIDNWIYNGISIPSSELTLVHKDGHDVHVFSQHVMIEVSPKHFEMYCIDIDLAEIDELQKELVVQGALLRTVINVIPDLIWLKDSDGHYLACNSKFEQFFGAQESEILGKTDFDFVDAEVAQFFRDNDKKAIELGTSHVNEEFLSFADGSYKGTFETIRAPVKDFEGNVTGVLGIARDITQRKVREEKLETYAHYDTLTGLANRSYFLNRLTQLLSQRKKFGQYSAILFIDLDHFKEINDTMGHSYGDKVLIEVANRLHSVMREEDTLARLGGDEFTVLLEKISSPLEAGNVAQKISNALKEAITVNDHQFYVTGSVGIAVSPTDGTDAESLLRFADSAMYKAKENGRNGFEFYTQDLSKRAFERVMLENSLRQAIKNSEFILCYQPQIDAKENRVIGAEALIRWKHNEMGIISPNKFIPIAEISGQIIAIGKWVIHEAMREITSWKEAKLDIETISINLSVKQLHDKALIDVIEEALHVNKCQPEWIEFEVTESYAMSDPKETILILEKICSLGCKLSIDDFGTGYSSLSYLKRLPVHKLKIDQSFVQDIPGNDDDEAIVKAVILIAQSMRLEVIAEGVEEQVQQEFLLKHGCTHSQGYLYAKALPSDEFIEYLKKF